MAINYQDIFKYKFDILNEITGIIIINKERAYMLKDELIEDKDTGICNLLSFDDFDTGTYFEKNIYKAITICSCLQYYGITASIYQDTIALVLLDYIYNKVTTDTYSLINQTIEKMRIIIETLEYDDNDSCQSNSYDGHNSD